jgi:hypothetical protein
MFSPAKRANFATQAFPAATDVSRPKRNSAVSRAARVSLATLSSPDGSVIASDPVKHGLVPRVSDWPYSSFHRMVKLGVYPERL